MFAQLALAVLLCVHSTFAKLTIPRFENRSQQVIVQSANEIVNHNFDLRKVTVVLYKDVEEVLVDEFLKEYRGTVILESKMDAPMKQVVLFVDSFLSFMKIMKKMKPDLKGKSLLHNEAKFLIVLLGSRKNIERISNILWNYYVTDAVIVTRNRKNKVVLYTYHPYKNHLQCQNTDLTFIGFWNKSTKQKQLYLNKMLNMNECPLYISTNKIKYPLTEKKIALEVIKKSIIKLFRDILNFTPIISVRDYISIDSDRARNWSDSLSDVLTGVANISTCTIPLGIDRSGLLDYSMPYFRVRLIWLAPPVSAGPGWWRLFSPLNGYLWLILLIVIFNVKFIVFIIKIKPVNQFCIRYLKDSTKLKGVVFRVWGILVGQPVRLGPRKFRDFYIVGLWMWFTFVVRSAYQSVLIGALKTDTMVGNFANLRETVEAGYEIGGRAGIFAHFEYDQLIKERFKLISEADFEKVFFDVVEGRRKFVLATSWEYAFAYCLSAGKSDKECGHVLPDSIMSVPLVIWMKIHSPFKKAFSIWLPRLIESGLLQRSSGISSPSSSQIISEPSALTHHQILSCMLCLFFGYVLSFAIFLLENVKYSFEHIEPYRN